MEKSQPLFRTEEDLLSFLEEKKIPYQRSEHPPVYTCEEAERYQPQMGGVSTKNLFLRDRHGKHYLVVTDCGRSLDLKSLGQKIDARKLHFGSEEELLRLLGVTRGAVTMLGLVNDAAGEVKLYIDSQIWPAEVYLCHPMVNTATLALKREGLERFFALTGHEVEVFSL